MSGTAYLDSWPRTNLPLWQQMIRDSQFWVQNASSCKASGYLPRPGGSKRRERHTSCEVSPSALLEARRNPKKRSRERLCFGSEGTIEKKRCEANGKRISKLQWRKSQFQIMTDSDADLPGENLGARNATFYCRSGSAVHQEDDGDSGSGCCATDRISLLWPPLIQAVRRETLNSNVQVLPRRLGDIRWCRHGIQE